MKKSRRRLFLHLLFWFFIALGILWIAFAPTSPHKYPFLQVKIDRPEEPIDKPPVGEEKSERSLAPFKPEDKHQLPTGTLKIAIVIDDVGLDIKNSKRATNLPAYITLSFMPYASQLREQTKEARDLGHELLLHMPMEPMGHDNPGPGALLVSLSPDEIRQRFQTALASFVGFDGVNNHMGSRFTADPVGMEIVIDELKQRDLFFLDSRTSAQTIGEALARQHALPTIARDVFLDDAISFAAIRNQLEQTERTARRKGYAVAIGHPHSLTLEALEKWLPEAEKRGIQFVRLKELIRAPEKN